MSHEVRTRKRKVGSCILTCDNRAIGLCATDFRHNNTPVVAALEGCYCFEYAS